MTFKGFNDSKRLLDRFQYFDILESKTISTLLQRSWKKSFDNGIVLPLKMKRCNECKGETLSDACNNQVNENKKLEVNLNSFNSFKKDFPNQFDQTLSS